MVADVPLESVIEAMGSGRTYPATMRKFARQFGVIVMRHGQPMSGKGPSGEPGVCFLEGKRKTFSHWIAWDGNSWHDPRLGIYEELPDDCVAAFYFCKKYEVPA
jgi:hypothetical protein